MIIVTGGAGFIGANLVETLNREGESSILVVDNLTNAPKFLNLRELDFADFMDKIEFREGLRRGRFDHLGVRAIFHQGACSDTMEYDGRYMMDNNFTYSKELFHFAAERRIPFVYASSAATYGNSPAFAESRDNEKPLNVYGYSKLLFDRYVARHRESLASTAVGLRYFNVYGPREAHKGRMASMVHQLWQQVENSGTARLFEGTGGYGHGEQRRDFVFVGDACRVNLHFSRGAPVCGVFNVGTGRSRSFNDIVHILFRLLGRGELIYTPMPETLRDKYQNFTEAELTRLRDAGYRQPFTSLEEGIAATLAAVTR
ncbi:MAG: ADP-glyceromanno-heptose 6-epimerase [Magnetococcales bacterium]|nr:ADP-glyceromanno-heptose 6-epimerase [Magnetococcales bacterium]MBF0157681.1 ADP-glyceromanno-heptose 6-epimerase [Magnetococcales bacterium]